MRAEQLAQCQISSKDMDLWYIYIYGEKSGQEACIINLTRIRIPKYPSNSKR